MRQPQNFFFGKDDLPLCDLDQIYMTSSIWHDAGMADTWATFDLLVRDMPAHRNFMVFTGLEEMIYGFKNLRYSPEDIGSLLECKLISKKFADYLKDFRFAGDVWALSEGSIYFPGEPVLRVTAPLIHCNLFSAFLMNALVSNSVIASKMTRCRLAAAGYQLSGTGPHRALSFEAALKCSRNSTIVGGDIPTPAFRNRLNLKKIDRLCIAFHAFISSFPSELEAMRAAANFSRVDLSVMVDTYDFDRGLDNAVIVAKELAAKGRRLKIVIDSGDLKKLAIKTRTRINKEKLENVYIALIGNLNEYRISELVKAKVPVDNFTVNTEVLTSSDSPKMEAVYKIAELIREGNIEYKMKLAPGKLSLPGRKQVFRLIKDGLIQRDVIGLEDEKIMGQPLLKEIFRKGRLVYELPELPEIKRYLGAEIKKLPERLKRVDREFGYSVQVSPGLKKLMKEVRIRQLSQYK